jgi:hypothetical protein
LLFTQTPEILQNYYKTLANPSVL